MKKSKKGFTLLELGISLGLIAIIYISFLEGLSSVREDARTAKEISYYSNFEQAFKRTFIASLDAAEQKCTQIATDNTGVWGWKDPTCKNSDPFPVFKATGGAKDRILYWDFDFTGTVGLSLRNTIKTSFHNICPLVSETGTRLTLRCSNLLNLQYNVGSGYTAATPKAALGGGLRIDPIMVPSVRLRYERHSTLGKVIKPVNFDFTMNDVYTLRQVYSRTKINQIRKSLFQFHKSQIFAEIGNPPASGLHSMDDEFIPWFWEAFRPAASLGSPPLCVLSGASCGNLSSWWRTSVPLTRGGYMRSIISLFFSGDTRFTVDGFGNTLYVYPIASQCTTTDFSTCVVTAPPMPTKSYVTGSFRPPYSSAIYIEGYGSKTTTPSAYTRAYVAY